MAALPLCASWSPPSGVAVASHSARPASRLTHIHSLGQRGPSPLPIRIQAGTHGASHLRSPKAADREHGLEPQPKPERGDDEPDAAASTEETPFVDLIPSNSDDIPEIQELRKFHKAFCEAWLPRETPDLFRIEEEEISNYVIRISSSGANVQDVNNKLLALFVCAQAQDALDVTSMVMDFTYIESLDRGKIQLFDQHIAHQVIGMCTSIFCHIAKAAYLKRIETDTVLSFLGALRGLGMFCDMLVQQILFELKDGPLKNSISNTMGTHSRKFDKKMASLKEQFIESTADSTRIKHTVVMETLFRGTKHAQSHILQMMRHRRETLIPLCLAQEYARRDLVDGSQA